MSKEWRRDPSAGDPGGWKPLEDRLRRIESRLNALANGAYSEYVTTGPDGIRIKQGAGLRVDDGGAVQSGDFEHGEAGWRLQDDTAEFNRLVLRDGIIGNDALTNPVRGDVTRAAESNFSLTTAWKTLATATWDIPEGFDHVQASGIAKAFAVNGTAALDYLYVRSRIVRLSDSGELLGIDTPVAVSQSGGSGTGYSLGVGVLNFYPGDQVRLEVQARTAFAGWAANAANVAEWAGSLTWYRA